MNPSETTYQEGMRFECAHCHEQAQRHRLTKSGNLYCLIIKTNSTSFWKFKTDMKYSNDKSPEARKTVMERVAMQVTVRDLVLGNFPTGLGKALQLATSSFIKASPA